MGVRDDQPRRALAPAMCLDFVNTRYWRGRETPAETFNAPEDLLAWAVRYAGAPAQPAPAALLESGLALRELLHRIFAARAAGGPVAAADLADLNAALADAPSRSGLVVAGEAYAWRTTPGRLASGAAVLLAPVLWSAADLLAESGWRQSGREDGEWAGQARLRACANPECRWLFIDASRNGSRRWCDMAACGNRAKAHRHYLRVKATKG